MEFVQYKHHGKKVFVREELKGHHKEFCLCYRCKTFEEFDPSKNCPTANMVYAMCVKYNLVLPVWECPKFKEKEVVIK
jgi:hypothetical protein